MPICPTIDPAIGTAQTMIASVNCYVEASVAQSYGALMGPGGGLKSAMTAALVIYVAILGYRFMLGRTRLAMGDLVPRLFLIGAILALTTSWATYQTLVYNTLTDGPEEIAQMVSGGQAQKARLAERVDRVSQQLTSVANDWGAKNLGSGPLGIVANTGPQSNIAEAANAARMRAEAAGNNPLSSTTSTPAITSSNPFSSAPNFLSWSAMLLTLTAAGSIAITKALLGMLLAIGPAFALFALFHNTRGLAVGWARAALFLSFVPMFATLTTLAILTMLEPMAAALSANAARGSFALNDALAIFIAVLVMNGIALLGLRVAGMMVSGWVISLKDQVAGSSQSAAFENHTEFHANSSNGAFVSASTGQPRLDQMVQAIERTNATNSVQMLQRPDTRVIDMSTVQTRRADDTKAARVPALLPANSMPRLSSPLRPARSWS